MPEKKDVAIRKRQQIATANRRMFLWVAGASVILGAAVVLVFFLVRTMIFNEKVLAEKNNTVSTLQKNNEVADKLKENVRVINTNQDLIDLETEGDNEPAQVLLDALPSQANSAALGASLQSNKLLGQSGVTLESLVVNPVSGSEDSGEDSGASDESTSTSENAIQFTFSISTNSSNGDALKKVLQKLESSIRSINLTSVTVQNQGSKLVMTAQGEAYYEPAQTIDLKEKAVPDEKN